MRRIDNFKTRNVAYGVLFFSIIILICLFFLKTSYAGSRFGSKDLPPDRPSQSPGFHSERDFRSSEERLIQNTIKEEETYGGPHKRDIIENLKQVEKSIRTDHWPKMTPVGSFHGQLRAGAPVKIVYGLSSYDPYRVQATFGNVYRASEYLSARKIPYSIEVVVSDIAVRYFDTRRRSSLVKTLPEPLASELIQYIRGLQYKKHVKIFLCRNAMTGSSMVRHDIPTWVHITPMASLEIVRRVKQGYVYITN